MLNKKQKIWLYIFGAMFLIPEILFLNIVSSIFALLNNFSATGIKAPISYIFDSQIFYNNPSYVLALISIEWVGVLGMLIVSIKNKKNIIAILLTIVLIILSIVFGLGYMVSHMGF